MDPVSQRKIDFDVLLTPGKELIRDPVKVFIRVRPLKKEEKDKMFQLHGIKEESLDIEDNKTLILRAPKMSQAYKLFTFGVSPADHKFFFSRVFPRHTTQHEVFEQVALPNISSLIDGSSFLLFTYGVTNSGKTFTVHGTVNEAGLIPRTVEVLFNTLEGHLYQHPEYKPLMAVDIDELDDAAQAVEEKNLNAYIRLARDEIDHGTSVYQGSFCSSMSSTLDAATQELYQQLGVVFKGEKMALEKEVGRDQFCMWVSFLEVYNETVYDLLEPDPERGKPLQKLAPLRLRDDLDGYVYVKGLREVFVRSMEDVFSVLRIGQRHLHVARTALNHQSSRSHCVFQLRLIRVSPNNRPRLSVFAFCDLAGAERSAKTQNRGDRLKETGNINASLLTLKRCVDALRQNQKILTKDQWKFIPYRESKITRLFQAFFTGRGAPSILINVSPDPSLFDETLNVLRFGCLAQELVVCQPLVPPPSARQKGVPERLTIAWDAGVTFSEAEQKAQSTRIEIEEELEEEEDSEDVDKLVDDLYDENEKLRQRIKQLKQAQKLTEWQVRQQVVTEFSEDMRKMREEHQEHVCRLREQMESQQKEQVSTICKFYEDRLLKRRRQEREEREHDERSDLLEEEVDRIKSEMQRQMEEKVKLQQRVTEAEMAQSASMKQLAKNAADLEETRKRLKEAEAKLEENETELFTLREKVDRSEFSLLEKLAEEIPEQELHDKNLELKSLTEEKNELSKEVETLRKRLEAVEQSNKQHEGEQKRIRTVLERRLEGQRRKFEARIEELTTQLKTAEKKLSAIETERDGIKGELVTLREELHDKTSEADGLERVTVALRKQMTQEIEDLSRTTRDERKLRESKERESKGMEEKVAKMSSEIERLRKAALDSQQQYEEMMKMLEDKLDSLSVELENRNTELEKYRSEKENIPGVNKVRTSKK